MVNDQPKQKRRSMLAETRLLSEYLAQTYPLRDLHFQFRVGTTPELVGVQPIDDAEINLVRSLNRRVDAIVAPPPDLVVIEATMYKPTEKVGRLQEYLFLLPATPEYQQWRGYPVVPMILSGQHDSVAEVLCQRLGFRYVFFEPTWIDEFYAQYPARRRRSPHTGMTEALRGNGSNRL